MPRAITSLHGATSSIGPPLLTGNRSRFRLRWQSNYCRSSWCKAHASGTTLSPWTSCGFICSVSISEHDLMWTAPGEIVVDRERHTVQSPKFMLRVVWNPIGFHVLKALVKGCKFNAQYYYIIQMISWSQSQIGGGRPGEHRRTSCG
jgi:hypothetical protein